MAAEYRPPISSATQAALTAEATTRASADTALSAADVAEATARANADSAEVTARTNAINAAITGEASARASGDATNATAIAAEATTRAAADTANADAIAAEATSRIAADTTLTAAVGLKASTAALTAETTARTDADTALDGRLGAVESSSGGGSILSWTPDTDYRAGQPVTIDGRTYLANADHTSASVFSAAGWTLLPTVSTALPALPVTGMEVWFRSDSGVVLSEDDNDDGTYIDAWQDQSPYGRHALKHASIDTRRPTLVEDAWHGKPGVYCHGTSGLSTPAGLGPFTDGTWFLVAMPHTYHVGEAANAASYYWDAQTTGERQSIMTKNGQWMGHAGSDVPISHHPSQTPQILSFVNDGVASFGRCDGLQAAAADAGAHALSAFRIAGSAGYNAGADGHIFEFIYYARVLTDVEIQEVESYLNQRWFGQPRAPIPDATAVTLVDNTRGVPGPAPGFCRLATGDYLVSYRIGVAHIGTDAVIETVTISEDLTTVSAPVVAYDPPAGIDVRTGQLTTLSDGTVIMACWENALPGAARLTGNAFVLRSTDGGVTWSAKIPVTTSFTQWSRMQDPVLELPGGDLLVATNGGDTTSQATDYVRVSRSTDKGLTWFDDGEVLGIAYPADLAHQEPTLCLLNDGVTVICFVRSWPKDLSTGSVEYEAVQELIRVQGTIGQSGDITWGEPFRTGVETQAAPNCIQVPNGDIHMFTRKWFDGHRRGGWMKSSDGGYTWTDYRNIAPEHGSVFMIYGAWVQLRDDAERNFLGAVMSFQDDEGLYFYRVSNCPIEQVAGTALVASIDSVRERVRELEDAVVVPPTDPWAVGGVIENIDRLRGAANTAVLSSGRLSLAGGFVIPAGQPILGIRFFSATTPANAPTHQWFALVDQLRNVLVKTADGTTGAWASNDDKSLLFAAPYIPDDEIAVYAGIVVVATTVPSMLALTHATSRNQDTPIMAGSSTTGLTDPASLGATAGAISATAWTLCAELILG